MSLVEAVRAYTINPARQDFAEGWKGSIEVGKVADLCVLDRPLLDLDPHSITDAEVDLTVFDGRVSTSADLPATRPANTFGIKRYAGFLRPRK
ncbi:amidohydrolase family protein [Streptomyces lusitanus]|uniref:amidohydrolase family protein n=1 Tax=Streptomyces lusitanus TaxID=68232 RepID=UPI00362BA315